MSLPCNLSRFFKLRTACDANAGRLGRRAWLSIFAVLALGAVAATPQADYSVRQWTAADGLPTEDIEAVAQDGGGFLWLATSRGLLRFDGARFRLLDSAQPDSPRPAVVAVTRSADYGLVVALAGGGVAVLKDGGLQAAVFSAAVGERLVTSLFCEKSGTLWIACSDGWVFRVSGPDVQSFVVPRGLPGARRIGFATDGAGRIWVSSDLTLLRYENGQLLRHPQEFGGDELRIVSSRAEGPWVITESNILQWSENLFRPRAALPRLLGAHYVQAGLEDRRGGLWLATRSQGLQYFSGKTLDHFVGLGDEIISLCEDTESSLWVVTRGAGLARLRLRPYRLFNKSSGLLVDFSSSVCEDANGDVWLANRDGGAVRWREGDFVSHGPLPDWPTYSAVSVFPKPGGGVGFTCGAGAYWIGAGERPEIVKIAAVPAPPIVRVTYGARNGDVWLALAPGKIGRLRGQVLEIFGSDKGVPNVDIRSFGETAAGDLLIGTATGALLRLAHGSFVSVLLGTRSQPNPIQAILVDHEQRVWLGTEHGGVLTLDPSLSSVGVCDAARGLPDDSITQIVADDRGYLWFGSAAGVFRASRAELLACLSDPQAKVQPTLIASDSGASRFASVGQYQPAAFKAHNGLIWFATRRGVLQVDPAAEFTAPAPPRVGIDAIVWDDHVLSGSVPAEVSARGRKLEVRFSTLSLAASELLRVRYRLEGHDAGWQEAEETRTATYLRLPAGRYVFHVVARMADGSSREAEESQTIVVHPTWWQSGWFESLMLLVAIALVAAIVRTVSNRRLLRKLQRVEHESALERERARIARDIHDDLGASLSRVSLLTQEARQRTALPQVDYFGKIYDTVSQITRSMDEIVWAVDPRYDDLDGLASYLSSYAQDFLSVAGLRCRLDVPDRLPAVRLSSQQRHHLFLCLKEALNNVVHHARASGVTISLSTDEATFVMKVADDGIGMAQDQAREGRRGGGNGLHNMRERMRELGGTCDVITSPTPGTLVVFELPIKPPAR